MKNIKILLSFSLLISSFSFSYGQSWIWGEAGYGSIKTNDYGTPVTTDNQGNAYTTGQYSVSIFFGNDTLNSPHAEAPFLVKYNSNGIVQWAKQPGMACDGGYGLTVSTDPSGNILLLGVFVRGDIIFGNDTLSNAVYNDVFLAKYNSSGTVLWAKQSTFCGGSLPYSVTCDDEGNTYITGYFSDSISFGSNTLKSASMYTSFLAKYDPNGNVMWAKQATGDGTCRGTSVTTHKGFEYLTGYFKDTITFGLTKLISDFGNDVFTIKYDSNGNVIWAEQSVGAANFDVGQAISSDYHGNIYVGGFFYDTINFGSQTLSNPNKLIPNAFLIKYNSLGNIIWAKKSNLGSWYGFSLATDDTGNIYYGGLGRGDSIQWGSMIISTTVPNSITSYAAFIIEIDTGGNPKCGTIQSNGAGTYMYSSVCVASDSTGRFIYEGGLIDNDSLFCGPDTLSPPSNIFAPYVARWKSCDGGPLGVNELRTKDEKLTVSPNPFTSSTTISLNSDCNHYLELDDITGRKLKQLEFSGNTYTLSAEGLAKGMYFIRVSDKDKNVVGTSKIVVQ